MRPAVLPVAAARLARRFGAASAIDEPMPPRLSEEVVVAGRHIDRCVRVCETHKHAAMSAVQCTAGPWAGPLAVVAGVLGWDC